MSKQFISDEILIDLSEAEQEASNGGLSMLPTVPSSPTITPSIPSIPINIFGSPSPGGSCPACSSGMSPNYTPSGGT